MHNKRSEEGETQKQQARDQAPVRDDRSKTQQEPQNARKPSKIERREWRGAGVCGDRHTD